MTMNDTPHSIIVFDHDGNGVRELFLKTQTKAACVEFAAKLKPEYRMRILGKRSVMGERQPDSTDISWHA